MKKSNSPEKFDPVSYMYQVLQEEIKENKKHQSKLKKSGHTWKVSELGKRLRDDASTLINKAFAQ